MIAHNDILIKPYTLQQLATRYGVARSTMRRWLKPHLAAIGERYGNYYTTKQVRIIFNLIGEPSGKGED